MSSFFQSSEMLIAYAHVCMVEKHPPDRLEVLLSSGERVILLNDDCKPFYQGLTAWLQTHPL